jgi:hypothetical protein
MPDGDSGVSACGSWEGGPSLGVCLSIGLAPPISNLSWPPDVCATGFLCVARIKVDSPSNHFSMCSQSLGPGACWPAYIMDDIASGTASAFPQATCAVGERCMPCSVSMNPLMFCND